MKNSFELWFGLSMGMVAGMGLAVAIFWAAHVSMLKMLRQIVGVEDDTLPSASVPALHKPPTT